MAEKFDPSHAAKLENPERLVELPPARLVELLRLSGAETVVDFGAGTGMYSLPVAEALPDGTLYAVDAQQVLLRKARSTGQAQAVLEYLFGHGTATYTALGEDGLHVHCLLYTSPSPRDRQKSRMPSSA